MIVHSVHYGSVVVHVLPSDSPSSSLFGSCFQDGTPTSKTFEHVASEIGAEEAEEVGVEHLLR